MQKTNCKKGILLKGGFNLKYILVVSLVVSLLLVNAKECSDTTLQYQTQRIGMGAFHITTTDPDRTGVQKTFDDIDLLDVAVALHMAKEGLYPPIIETCHYDTEYLVTSKALKVQGNVILSKQYITTWFGKQKSVILPNKGWEQSFADFKRRVLAYQTKYRVNMWDVIQFDRNGDIIQYNPGNFMADTEFGKIYVVDADFIGESAPSSIQDMYIESFM